MGRSVHAVLLLIALAALWLTLSGQFHNGLLIMLGAASVTLVIFLVGRMGILDGETSPYHRLLAAMRYWVWLGGEIAKANIVVARTVLKADLEITPRLFRVPAAQATDLGKTIFANSITLTPGTVTVDVDGDELIVHALLDSMTEPAGFADMGERARRAAEGGVL